MARKLLDLAKDKIETLFGKIEDNFAELYQDKTQKDQEIQSLATQITTSSDAAKSMHGLADPSVTTAANYVGQHYTNILTGDQFTCISISENDPKIYTWLPSNSAVLQTIMDALSGKVDWSKFSNPNLLDNWYFVDPINQKGWNYNAPLAATGYIIDRWFVRKQGISLDKGTGITIRNTLTGHEYQAIDQRFESKFLPNGQLITISVLYIRDGITKLQTVSGAWGTNLNTEKDDGFNIGISANYPSSDINSFRIVLYPGPEVILIAAKLELGDKQTLAHKDSSGNWVLNDPIPDYNLELMKCQKYFYAPALDEVVYAQVGGTGVAGSSEALSIPVNLPVRMRVVPVISYTGDWCIFLNENSDNIIPVTSMTRNQWVSTRDMAIIRVIAPVSLGNSYTLHRNNNKVATISFDANL